MPTFASQQGLIPAATGLNITNSNEGLSFHESSPVGLQYKNVLMFIAAQHFNVLMNSWIHS
jgi:hypothetical protein